MGRPGSETELRVLQVIESLAPGGAERALVDLSLALQKRGHVCAAVSITPSLQLADELTAAGIEVFTLGVENPRDLVRTAVRLTRLVDRLSPDVIHCHLFFAELATAAATVRRPQTRARVVTFHNLGYESYPVNSIWRRFRRRLEMLSVRGFEAHLAGGESIARHYGRHLSLPSVTAVPYAVRFIELPGLSARERAARLSGLGLDPGRPLVVLPGSFRPEKGHRYLLAALARLREQGLPVQAAFTSAGPLRDQVEAETVALGLEDSVCFLGVLPTKAEVVALMAMSDLVALPSMQEGYPISAIEAMGAGAAVVASDVGGLAELIDDGVTGRLVRPGDPEELAAAITELLGDPACREAMGRTAAEVVRRRHRPAAVAARHDVLYQEAIARARGACPPKAGGVAAGSPRFR